MAICNTCGIKKPDSLFPQWNKRRSGLKCNDCRASEKRARLANEPGFRERANKAARDSMRRRRGDPAVIQKLRKADRARSRAPSRAAQLRIADEKRRSGRREYLARKRRQYYEANPAAYLARDAARRAALKKASFATADALVAIRKFHELCPSGLHVDHIVPIKNHTVCGLHVVWNLQYLPPTDNMRKHNRFSSTRYETWVASGELGPFLG